MKRLAFWALLACGAGSLLFDLTLSSRLPREGDWAELAGVLRAETGLGDAAQIWPAWAEESRLYIDSMPVLAEEDLVNADYPGVVRLWAVSLPRYGNPEKALRERGATPANEPRRFGALQLQAWNLHAPEIAALTDTNLLHEVDYVARRCQQLRIGSTLTLRGPALAMLHVRAGVIGERAYDAGKPPIIVNVFAGGAPLAALQVPRTERDGTGWRRLDVPVPAGDPLREFSFAVESHDGARPFCLQAWTSK
ncbi:MAG TPA: hypothetical protein VH083_09185 [Myxococcales bacterium]|jgi:hypothetical protein|nr:hypothetical protein [Myxococcales bacterium]